MKKILTMLVMAALVLGMVAAQDGELIIKGSVKTGVEITAANEYAVTPGHEKDKAYIDAHSDDAGRAFQANVQFDYVTENSGVSVRLRADDKTGMYPMAFSPVDHAYGWLSFLNNMVEVSGGLLDNKKWGTFTDFYLDTSLDNRNFMKLAITPIEGLSFGVNTVGISQTGITELGDAFAGSVVGAKYEVPETFGVAAAFIFNAKEAKASSPNSKIGLNGGGTFGALFSAYYYGVENLKVDLDGRLATDKDSDFNTFGIGLQGNYQVMEPLTAGLRVVFSTSEAKEDNIAFVQFRPQAAYTATEWLEFGLQIPIGLQGNVKGLDDADIQIGVKPQATFKLNENAKFVAFYQLDATSYNKKSTHGPAEKTGITNTVQLDFVWTF